MENTIYELEGLSENPLEYEKNFDIIKKAINHCKANGFKVLKLPKGTFNIWNQKADDLRKALLSGEISATDDIRWHIPAPSSLLRGPMPAKIIWVLLPSRG